MPRDALMSAHALELQQSQVDVWADNWPAVQLFMSMSTQWLRDAAGHQAGLNYGSVPRVEQQLRLHGRRAREAFSGMQVMEAEWVRLVRAEAAAKARARKG